MLPTDIRGVKPGLSQPCGKTYVEGYNNSSRCGNRFLCPAGRTCTDRSDTEHAAVAPRRKQNSCTRLTAKLFT
jgi:hypothetical protein